MRVRAPGEIALTVMPASAALVAACSVADHTAALAAPYPRPPAKRGVERDLRDRVDDPPVALVPHHRKRGAHGADGRLEVHREQRVELGVDGLLDLTPATCEPGVVHDDVDAPEGVERGGRLPRLHRPATRHRSCPPWPPHRPIRSRRRPAAPGRRRHRPSRSVPRSFTTTRMPPAASAKACARPSPRPAPVTSATRAVTMDSGQLTDQPHHGEDPRMPTTDPYSAFP